MVQYACQYIALVLLWVIVPDKEDGSMGKGTTQDEARDVLVMSVKGSLGGEVLCQEGIRRERIHVLCHKRGDGANASQRQPKLEV